LSFLELNIPHNKQKGHRKLTSMEYALPSRKLTRSAAKSGGDLKMIPIAKL
jgi:hypothetical protein